MTNREDITRASGLEAIEAAGGKASIIVFDKSARLRHILEVERADGEKRRFFAGYSRVDIEAQIERQAKEIYLFLSA